MEEKICEARDVICFLFRSNARLFYVASLVYISWSLSLTIKSPEACMLELARNPESIAEDERLELSYIENLIRVCFALDISNYRIKLDLHFFHYANIEQRSVVASISIATYFIWFCHISLIDAPCQIKNKSQKKEYTLHKKP